MHDGKRAPRSKIVSGRFPAMLKGGTGGWVGTLRPPRKSLDPLGTRETQPVHPLAMETTSSHTSRPLQKLRAYNVEVRQAMVRALLTLLFGNKALCEGIKQVLLGGKVDDFDPRSSNLSIHVWRNSALG